jgi:hypothetical protein
MIINSYGGDGMLIVHKSHGDNGKGQVRILKVQNSNRHPTSDHQLEDVEISR